VQNFKHEALQFSLWMSESMQFHSQQFDGVGQENNKD
jgi:hypothetical protein